jgi:hypothetical protein
MKKYPKKCPKCKEYMEPLFIESSHSHISNYGEWNRSQQPHSWKCLNCKHMEEVSK